MLEVIDNFVSPEYADSLERMCKEEIAWHLDEHLYGPNYYEIEKQGSNYKPGRYGFYHFALDQLGNRTIFADKILPLVYSLEEKAGIKVNDVYRIRLALTTSMDSEVLHGSHIDMEHPHKVLLYYVNDSDGDTVMYNEFYTKENGGDVDLTFKEKISPKKNRAVIFDGLRYHNSIKPIQQKTRFIININFA